MIGALLTIGTLGIWSNNRWNKATARNTAVMAKHTAAIVHETAHTARTNQLLFDALPEEAKQRAYAIQAERDAAEAARCAAADRRATKIALAVCAIFAAFIVFGVIGSIIRQPGPALRPTPAAVTRQAKAPPPSPISLEQRSSNLEQLHVRPRELGTISLEELQRLAADKARRSQP
jgi:hypothetical protein